MTTVVLMTSIYNDDDDEYDLYELLKFCANPSHKVIFENGLKCSIEKFTLNFEDHESKIQLKLLINSLLKINSDIDYFINPIIPIPDFDKNEPVPVFKKEIKEIYTRVL